LRAIVVTEHGPPQVLVASETPAPVPGSGETLVDVEIANVTFVETQVRAGTAPFHGPPLPYIPGNGVGGTVVAVGEGVDSALVGTEVITSLDGSGGYAERAVADAAALIPVPEGMAIADAVAILADGRTAMGLMDSAQVDAGETVLVEAAAGGVGSLLVQLARNAGAEVVAAAGGPRKLELARGLGAEVVVDYTEAGWADRVREEVGGVNVVFDGVGGAIGREAFELLVSGGRFCAFGLASGAFADVTDDEAAARGVGRVRNGRASPEHLRELTRSALGEAASGRLRPLVGQRFPLAQAAAAHAAIESRATVGKTVLVAR
jgi:NADPH2:quinone reductase